MTSPSGCSCRRSLLGSAADQPDSPRNTGHEQVKSELERADGVYLCAEGSPELQPAAGASSASGGGKDEVMSERDLGGCNQDSTVKTEDG